MCFLPQFEYDLFISYSHIDNKPVDGSEDGWVTVFHSRLEARVNQLLGQKIKVYRDVRLGGDEKFHDTLPENVQQSALFVAIVSPGFIKSPWCPSELATFAESASRNGGLYVDHVSRLYKVVKTEYPREATVSKPLNILNEVLGFEFCERDAQSDFLIEFAPESEEYLRNLHNLAQKISVSLQRLHGNPAPRASFSIKSDQEKVFVGYSSKDLKDDREALVHSLEDEGYLVLPQRDLSPYDTAREIERHLAADLAGCRLAVLFCSARYGLIPESEASPRRSLDEIQYDSIVSQAAPSNLLKLIRIPNDAVTLEEDQKNFIERIKKDVNRFEDLEWSSASVEDLKTIALDKLHAEPLSLTRQTGKNGHHTVYIIYDEQDASNADIRELIAYLHRHELETLFPMFKADGANEEELARDHWENLEECDSVLICYGTGTEPWRRAHVSDLRKLKARRATPLRCQAIYLGPEETPAKLNSSYTHRWLVMQNYRRFTTDQLNSFLKELGIPPKEDDDG